MYEKFDVVVHPVSELRGELTAQPSKNYTTRYLIAAALSGTETLVRGVATSEDSHALQECLQTWGAELIPEGRDMRVRGFGNRPLDQQTLNPHNAGAVARFLMALAGLTSYTKFITDYPESLGKRPHGDLLKALESLGARTTSLDGKMPIEIWGNLQGGKVSVNASLSSQYTSGLMFLAPLLPDGLEITLLGDIKSPGPLKQTIETLRVFGVEVSHSEDLRTITIAGGQRYHAPEVTVPGDYPGSSALLSAAAVMPGEVVIHNLHEHDLQGERLSIDVLKSMGADITREGSTVTVRGGKPLKAVVTDGDFFTDAVQALSAAAASAEGQTTWENVYTLRLKECDRISDTRAELQKLGLSASETEDSLSITGKETLEGGITVDGHGDHRMIMMLTILGLRAKQPITITGAHHIRKSYPDFFDHMTRLGAKFDFIER
ncbi:3-phosphoshikimate 1-carboxyvinyltransferase [Deinococcus cellulosilyticus]|uniref:3-phosphoshikimate 1-carboxyvinyltransferase n=1 Tax=Deinococcus cellulosilyticus (strain DSM 18568 / NBRC 106333 / KACC 11606 / 5516J-15) TaxID=1223518 RepID=A0A511N4T0_DEIC1|nr:3-phosphoshikimate 1-carboxyvinyltransferase [Deinococcus cellulosilyticus]GEM47446.1 3-phosphoshikimate 1-carboxyvinyltransferase [Deinococcus cellulosilyticus NBRC 106333 = KACC 11606]